MINKQKLLRNVFVSILFILNIQNEYIVPSCIVRVRAPRHIQHCR